jgi:bifunctional non-homologous end joining protein LigD
MQRSTPAFIEPMKARLVEELPQGDEWLYEVKFDGVRALAIKSGRSSSILSRTANDLTAKYPEIADALRDLPAKHAVLDGEIVALDPEGRSSFQLLQSWHRTLTSRRPPLIYYAFDLLSFNGRDLKALPLEERKRMMEDALSSASPPIRFSRGLRAVAPRLMREMQARGLEGLIAKKRHSEYEPGRRSGAWVKFKWSAEQEFVIGGYTAPKGSRFHFGALLVGYYEKNRLLFAGKVGTGFDGATLKMLEAKFRPLVRAQCPFANVPECLPGANKGMTRSAMRQCTWLEPRLVCQVRFTEWTRDHHLRQPAFLGLRDDKQPRDVRRE